MRMYKLFVFILMIVMLGACNQNEPMFSSTTPDYEDPYYWAQPPSHEIDKAVDVFYVYPTLFGGTGLMNMDVSNDTMRALVQSVLKKQAAVFENDCNLFAPYYRQMAMDGLAMDPQEQNIYFSIGQADVTHAFDYYLEHLNEGRPFILAGHSQGSMALIQLMKEKFNKPALMNQLVAAYLIGYSVTEQDLEQCHWFRIADSARDIGVIITYNTQSAEATNSPVLLPAAQCVNPLSWTRDSNVVAREHHLGAVFFSETGETDSIVPLFTNARINESGALIAGDADVEAYSISGFPKGVFHKYDYSFFFNNIKKNVGDRIAAYKGQRQSLK